MLGNMKDEIRGEADQVKAEGTSMTSFKFASVVLTWEPTLMGVLGCDTAAVICYDHWTGPDGSLLGHRTGPWDAGVGHRRWDGALGHSLITWQGAAVHAFGYEC